LFVEGIVKSAEFNTNEISCPWLANVSCNKGSVEITATMGNNIIILLNELLTTDTIIIH
jgi:hypothetical protein